MVAVDAESGIQERMADALGLDPSDVAISGSPLLGHAYPVSALAAAAVATTAAATARLIEALGHRRPAASVDRTLVDTWFAQAVRPIGWSPPPPWDPVAGDYPAADHWIRLHTNAAHHRAAALRVLGVAAEREQVAAAVAAWTAEELEAAVVTAGGCAAELRPPSVWAGHPQGEAVAAEPLVHVEPTAPGSGATSAWAPRQGRPLAGLRVLDLTRVLAGPVATRLLAGLGADVLRVDPPGWDEPALEPEVTLGKRCARLDMRDPAGLERMIDLLAEADVIVHGYRAGALASIGLGEDERQAIRPGLIDVSLTAYGHTGPWAGRRGFDSLVQMSTGIAAAGLLDGSSDHPTPLPVQALDHATGWLMAAAVLAGLARRAVSGEGTRSRLSLACTALELERGRAEGASAVPSAPRADLPASRIETPWGPADVLAAPFEIAGTPLLWDRAQRPLGSDPPTW